ncbi:MAG: His/Gly/Thr/Pro-type tRNA ligase C-terminal domain-containing protein [Patescibacteria group bacterium]|nr:His/Gly/Thr/Pro-type tRNA ligase C-terminal domain-containing protein [Patescibacteria group bacterium]
MFYSKLFGKTKKEIKNYDSISHKLLTQAGFIDQIASGIFEYLPLGKIVLSKIETIIRKEMNTIDAQEVLMPSLHPKILWEKTNRWNSVDVLFKIKSQWANEYALAPTHEETITPLAKKFIKSYKDLPLALYHITAKFRDEKRAKSGILRGREFGMKDLYSFHKDKKDLENYYQKVIKAYLKIFKKCGLKEIKITEASGGSFTKKFSHEFNVITPAGEVNLIYCEKCEFAQNEEIANNNVCPKCKNNLKKNKAIEVGNIFDLGTRFCEAFDLKFIDKDGKEKYPVMGCYGIGTTRLMGTIVEINNDEKGIIWPENIAPYKIHLIGLDLKDKNIRQNSYNLYKKLTEKNIEVLFDNREDVSAGEKFNDADLIGIPIRLIISKKTGDKIEYKKRNNKEIKIISFDELINKI